MPGVTKPAAGPVFKTDRFVARGITFELLEVEATAYDELVRLFTSTNGLGEEVLDEASFVTALTVKALVEPKRMTPETFGSYPQALRRTIETRCRAMHLVLDDVKIVDDEPADPTDPPADA